MLLSKCFPIWKVDVIHQVIHLSLMFTKKPLWTNSKFSVLETTGIRKLRICIRAHKRDWHNWPNSFLCRCCCFDKSSKINVCHSLIYIMYWRRKNVQIRMQYNSEISIHRNNDDDGFQWIKKLPWTSLMDKLHFINSNYTHAQANIHLFCRKSTELQFSIGVN